MGCSFLITCLVTCMRQLPGVAGIPEWQKAALCYADFLTGFLTAGNYLIILLPMLLIGTMLGLRNNRNINYIFPYRTRNHIFGIQMKNSLILAAALAVAYILGTLITVILTDTSIWTWNLPNGYFQAVYGSLRQHVTFAVFLVEFFVLLFLRNSCLICMMLFWFWSPVGIIPGMILAVGLCTAGAVIPVFDRFFESTGSDPGLWVQDSGANGYLVILTITVVLSLSTNRLFVQRKELS